MRSDNAAGTPAWESMTEWSGLPDVYVTKAKCQQGMFWRIEACSVPMAIGPEVRLIREDRVAKLIREAEARGMERAAEIAWDAANAANMSAEDEHQRGLSEAAFHLRHEAEAIARVAVAIRAEAASLRGEKEPK